MRPFVQYRLRTLLLLVTVAALVFSFLERPRSIKGTWVGLQGFSKYTFVFDGRAMHIGNQVGTVSTPYTISTSGGTSTIDFEGDNGLQRGIYQLSDRGSTLTLVVANSYGVRPTSIDAANQLTKAGNQSGYVRYTLHRAE